MRIRLLQRWLWLCLLAVALGLSACQRELVGRSSETEQQAPTREEVLVSIEEAREIARSFIAHNLEEVSTLRSAQADELELVHSDLGDLRALEQSGAEPSYYVFNVASRGYVIVSASRSTLPILGYSEESPFDAKDIPESMQAVLNDMRGQIRQASRTIKPSPSIQEMRLRAIEGRHDGLRAVGSVAPLLGRIKWNQRPYYNAYCPKGTPVGCVATATAQIMKYYEYPDRGQGEHSYTSSYGELSFDYDYPIEWDRIPAERLTSANLHTAYFNYGVAVALDMGFGANGSGTWQWKVPAALRNYYKYPRTVANRDRSDYTDREWKAIIRRELDAGRPVQYCGGGTGGAHSFVCDGYTQSGYFHFNWGWGGMSDGYFLLDALNPGSLGTGGGSGGYNYNQSIVVGFAPPAGHEPVYRNRYSATGAINSCITYIAQVALGQMVNTTGGCSESGYRLFTDEPISLRPGSEYQLRVYPGFEDEAYTEHWRVWIDFDGDYEFADDELVLTGQTTSRRGLGRTILVPQDAKAGKTRMRVSMKWGDYPGPNELFKHGEVEDYDLEILPGRSTPNPAPVPEPEPNPTPEPEPAPEPQPQPTPPAPGGYCAAQGWNSCSTYIAGVQLANINNPSEGCTKGYKYFDALTVRVESGKEYNMTLTPGFRSTAFDEYWRVWIDFDDDKSFEASELVLSGKSKLRNKLSQSIKIPSTATLGRTLRMRVLMSYQDTAEPCAVFDHGEVEDYNLIVEKPKAPQPTPKPSPQPTPGSYCRPSAGNPAGGYIRFVELGNIEHQSTYHNSGYSDFSAKMTRTVAGASVRYTISPEEAGAATYYYRIWIDYNGNKAFDADELVVNTRDTHSVYGRFTLRRNLAKGGYRVRVAMKVGSAPEPCEAIDRGEFEDYTIWIR